MSVAGVTSGGDTDPDGDDFLTPSSGSFESVDDVLGDGDFLERDEDVFMLLNPVADRVIAAAAP